MNEPETQTFAGIADAMAKMLALIKPATPERVHARAWTEEIIPQMTVCRIPPRFHFEAAGDWGCKAQKKVFANCQKLIQGDGAIIALVGERGTGKTTIAAQLVIASLWSDWHKLHRFENTGHYWRTVPYRKMADLISRFKPIYGDFGTIDAETLMEGRDAYCGADLAIIDELHDCEDMRMKDRILTDVLDRRYSRMRDTLLISNQTAAEFKASTSDSVLSRISEHGTIIECQWESWRDESKRGERKKGKRK